MSSNQQAARGVHGGGARPRARSTASRNTETMMRKQSAAVVAAEAAALVSREAVSSPLPHPRSVGAHLGVQE